MNCRELENRLDDFLDGTLDGGLQETLQTHVAACPRCRERVEREKALRHALRALPVEGPSEGFYDRALQHAMAHDHRRPRLLASGAIAASLALVLAGSLLFQRPAVEPGGAHQDIPGLTISLNEERDVKLVFSSAQTLARATFTVVLPPGVELRGHPGQREITWEGSLQKGRNLLVLPLIARGEGGGELTAYVSHGAKRKAFRMRMAVQGRRHSRSSINHQPITT